VTRYDWPAAPRRRDDAEGRSLHLGRFRPAPDIEAPDGAPAEPPPSPLPAPPVFADRPQGQDHLWFPIGPSVMVNGQATGTPEVAGRIRDLQVEPQHGLRVYAASASGGVWYSSDRGATWRPLDEFVVSPNRDTLTPVGNALSCGSIQVRWGAADDGSLDEVWVGTGEQSGSAGVLPGGELAGIGILHALGPAAGTAWSVDASPTPPRGTSVFRIADDPGRRDQLVAGTTTGLYVWPPGGPWAKVAPWTTAVGGLYPVDVVLTRPDVGHVRIWVAAFGQLHVAEFAGDATVPITPGTLAFQSVTLNNIESRRVQLAKSADGTRLYVLGLRKATDPKKPPVAHLWSVDPNASSLTNLSGTELPGLPPRMFMSKGDQSHYDMCITVHPDVPSRIYVGGAAVTISGEWNGAIYRCETTTSAVTPTLIGEGVHPDVHVLRVGPKADNSATDRTVWVGCDGGVFRSDAGGDPQTFRSRNDGLAVLEPGYVASHPTNAGIVAAGFQDNGTAKRIGDSLWYQDFRGDGGGIVFDPGTTGRYYRQYTGTQWDSSDNSGIQPVLRRHPPDDNEVKTSESVESDPQHGGALFYSGCDAVVHGGDTHFAMGTNRIWYTRDWGRSWVTLPTATDPRGRDNPDLAQDLLNPAVPDPTNPQYTDKVPTFLCCTRTYQSAIATGTGGVLAVKFAVPADDGANHVLRVLALSPPGLVWLEGTRAANGTGPFAWTRRTAQIFRDPNTPGETTSFTNGESLLFLPTAGITSDVAVHDPDHGPLGSCYVAAVGEATLTGTGAHRDTLWFFDGDSTWVPCGLRVAHPNGQWTGTRVTAPALAVLVDPADRATVYVGTSVGVVRGHLTIGDDGHGNPKYTWAWDQFVNGLPEAAVQDLSIHRFDGVGLLRAALQARGVWETDLVNATSDALTFVRVCAGDTRRRIPTPLTGPATRDEPGVVRWDDSPDIVVDATGQAGVEPPTEADLFGLRHGDRGTQWAAKSLDTRVAKVHVLVHQRWSTAAPANDLRVALVRHALPTDGNVPLGGLWAVLVSAAGSGTPPASLPGGWSAAGSAVWLSPSADVDTRMPRTVTFDVDFTADSDGSTFVLLAVVMSGTNQIGPTDLRGGASTDATTANDLVLRSPHVAARSIQLV
jgi:hypothetical protein